MVTGLSLPTALNFSRTSVTIRTSLLMTPSISISSLPGPLRSMDLSTCSKTAPDLSRDSFRRVCGSRSITLRYEPAPKNSISHDASNLDPLTWRLADMIRADCWLSALAEAETGSGEIRGIKYRRSETALVCSDLPSPRAIVGPLCAPAAAETRLQRRSKHRNLCQAKIARTLRLVLEIIVPFEITATLKCHFESKDSNFGLYQGSHPRRGGGMTI